MPSRVLLAAAFAMVSLRSAAAIDVTGTWNACLTCDTTCTTPIATAGATLVQSGTQVTGSLVLTTPATLCPVSTTIDPATGVFAPGSATVAPCPILVAPATASGGDIVGRWDGASVTGGGPLVARAACDPLVPNACDDGDPATTDACATTLLCGGTIPMPPSCTHSRCATSADCDDGNPCTTDVCDAALGCTHTIPAVPAACEDGDPCTTGDTCSGTTCVPGVPAAAITSPRLTLGRLQNLGGDDRLRFRGALAPPTTTTLDPVTSGIRLVVLAADGHAVADITVPGGLFDASTGGGWTSSNNKAVYLNRVRGSQFPLSAVVLHNRSAPNTPGLVQFKIKGKHGSYAVDETSLPLSVSLDLDPRPSANAGGCATFDGSALCTISPIGATVKCR